MPESHCAMHDLTNPHGNPSATTGLAREQDSPLCGAPSHVPVPHCTLPPPPAWLRGPAAWSGHAQTIWSALWARTCLLSRPTFRRERWTTPDDDFIDIDWLVAPPQREEPAADAPLLVLFHGLEGSSASHYALALADWAQRHGWRFAVPHFRSCSGEMNRAAHVYHSGDYPEIAWILERFARKASGPVCAAGVSLGGNALLRWAEVAGPDAHHQIRTMAAISAPLDLVASGECMDRGFDRWVYTAMFLRTLKRKARAKLAQYPDLFDGRAAAQASTLAAFDDAFTAPVHGFKDHLDYWTRCSSKPRLADIRIPTLVLNARNDPFIPEACLPRTVNAPEVTLWQPMNGGHLGFASGAFPGSMVPFADAIGAYLQQQLSTHG